MLRALIKKVISFIYNIDSTIISNRFLSTIILNRYQTLFHQISNCYLYDRQSKTRDSSSDFKLLFIRSTIGDSTFLI